MRIALIGFGGVSKAFVKLLCSKKTYLAKQKNEVIINYILASDGGIYEKDGICLETVCGYLEKKINIKEVKELWNKEVNFDLLLRNNDIDMIIEMTPTNKETAEPAMTYIKKSLEAGKHVISANKGPIMLAYNELNCLAAERGVQLAVGCTAGGALPTINAGFFDMAGAEITSMEGIFNGTTNLILDEMEKKCISYAVALKGAVELGIAETDPSFDVEGWDTAIKLVILTNILFREKKTLKDVSVEGITHITPEEMQKAKEEGKRLKLIGKTVETNGALQLTAKLERLDPEHPLYGVNGRNKAVKYTSHTLGDLTIIGGASGVDAAAASIFRDLINIFNGYNFSRKR